MEIYIVDEFGNIELQPSHISTHDISDLIAQATQSGYDMIPQISTTNFTFFNELQVRDIQDEITNLSEQIKNKSLLETLIKYTNAAINLSPYSALVFNPK